MKSISEEKETEQESLLREIGTELKEELKDEVSTWFRWALGGAVVGSIILGGFGIYVAGFSGFLVGAVAGALIGGIGAWIFYILVSFE